MSVQPTSKQLSFVAAFSSKAGGEVLEYLKDKYVKPSMFDTEPMIMSARVAEVEVIRHIEKMIEKGKTYE